ncbi:hypothetical protein TNCV_1808751 [Trichonephila clavipes]|nr:hypothetical protein TNCV_1808751 [Trichonephila clavipes]
MKCHSGPKVYQEDLMKGVIKLRHKIPNRDDSTCVYKIFVQNDKSEMSLSRSTSGPQNCFEMTVFTIPMIVRDWLLRHLTAHTSMGLGSRVQVISRDAAGKQVNINVALFSYRRAFGRWCGDRQRTNVSNYGCFRFICSRMHSTRCIECVTTPRYSSRS